jgi:Tfp pilus assembly protein PilF
MITRTLTRRQRALVYAAALVALPFVVYSNNYRHDFALDDAYTIVGNTSLRSLREIPRYFVDPSTYTSIREQAEYRPVLQTTYALNYWVSGYDTWSWHLVQILLHIVVTLGIFALTRRVLLLLGDDRPNGIAFAAAAIFAVHPAAAGVVDYLNARSSLLTAAFLLPALLAYMRSADTPRYSRPQWAAAALYALALFTKVEAVGALGALWAFDLWQRARETPGVSLPRAIRASFDRRTWTRLAPALVITAVYFVIRARVMAPFPLSDARHAADVGAYEYFVTQLTAWWYYVYRVVAPVRLVADYLAYPVYRSWLEPVVLLSAGAWLAVVTILVVCWKRAPYLLFLAIAAFAVLSPTSTIAPLAEMVNEHRPYLPMAILSLAAIIPAGLALRSWPTGRARYVLSAAAAIMFLALGAMTYRRNVAFSTAEKYWADILDTAPSSRAYLNHGLALMTANDMGGALRDYRRSLELAPNWYFTHINLGIAYHHLNQLDSARVSFDRAVAYDRFSGLALTWRGEFRLAQRDFAGARDDFARSEPLSLERYRNAKGLAAAAAGLGDTAEVTRQTNRMLELDRPTALADIASRAPASGTSPDAQQQLMTRGLDALRAGDATAAAARFHELLALNPAHYGAHYQLAVTLDRLGRTDEARQLWQRVLGMAEGFHDQPTIRAARERLARRP